MIALTHRAVLAPPKPALGAGAAEFFAPATAERPSRGHACRSDACSACGLCPRHAAARLRQDEPPPALFSRATAS